MNNAAQIAGTIKQQLGGGRFAVMTGAKNFSYSEDGSLNFHIPRTKNIRAVKVTLDADDTYTMTFMSIHKYNVKTVAEVSGVYCDQLQSVFTEKTGLYTRL